MQMTKNEYKEFLRTNANRIGKNGYTLQQYYTDADSVEEIIPLNLSKFPALSASTIKWFNVFFDEEDADRNGNYMLRGFTHRDRAEVNVLNCKYGDYTNGYSYFAYNENEYFIYTYCEGDTTCTLYPDRESYEKGYKETYEWYRKEYA